MTEPTRQPHCGACEKPCGTTREPMVGGDYEIEVTVSACCQAPVYADAEFTIPWEEMACQT